MKVRQQLERHGVHVYSPTSSDDLDIDKSYPFAVCGSDEADNRGRQYSWGRVEVTHCDLHLLQTFITSVHVHFITNNDIIMIGLVNIIIHCTAKKSVVTCTGATCITWLTSLTGLFTKVFEANCCYLYKATKATF